MEKRFVIVYEEGIGYNKETKFSYANDENEATQQVVNISLKSSSAHDNREVKRIFSFNERGDVDHYEMVLDNFKPTLRKQPRALPSGN